MYNFLTKNGQVLAFGLGVLVTAIFLVSVFSGMESFNALGEEDKASTGIFNFGLSGAILLTIVAAAGMVLFGLYQVVSNLKGSMKGIIGFGLLVAVFLITYATATGEATPFIQGAVDKFTANGAEFTEGNMKMISGGITTAVALIALAAVSFVVSEVINFFK